MNSNQRARTERRLNVVAHLHADGALMEDACLPHDGIASEYRRKKVRPGLPDRLRRSPKLWQGLPEQTTTHSYRTATAVAECITIERRVGSEA